MCAIVGFTGAPDIKTIESMLSVISNRGPDDRGFYMDGGINLGHNRLAIIDLSASGRQPMADPRNEVYIIFNGEIYNFLSLKNKLKGGYSFNSATDTEVIIAAYLAYGRECFLEYLDGMFAFALWDRRDRTLILARDRLGIKPLYWTETRAGIVFASEVRSIIRHPDVSLQPNFKQLPEYLMLRYFHNPDTAFQDINKLSPATALFICKGEIREKKYWRPVFSVFCGDKNDAIEQLRFNLCAAVKSHLVSDVPVAAMLSGGVDSSIISICAASSNRNFKSFTIGFDGQNDNEFLHAGILARKIGIENIRILIKPADISILPEIVFLNDEPVAGPSSLAYYLALRQVRKYAKVVLFGHGADEILSGYEQFKILRLSKFLYRIPGVRTALSFAAKVTNRIFPDDPGFLRLFEFVDAKDSLSKYSLLTAVISSTELRNILLNELSYGQPKALKEVFHFESDPETAAIQFEQAGWLPDDILHRVDRMTMACSLEGRVPFLDRSVVECANAVVNNLKLRGWQDKYILREAFRKTLPVNLCNRRKQRFNMPIQKFFGEGYEKLVFDLFTSDNYLTRNIFNRKGLLDLMNFRNKASFRYILSWNKLAAQFYSRQIWNIVVYMLWFMTVVEKNDPVELGERWGKRSNYQ